MPTFEVKEIGTSLAHDALFTVVMTDDEGVVRGGDHHWVRARFAYRAQRLYERRPDLHGAATSILRAAYEAEFRGTLTDPDPN